MQKFWVDNMGVDIWKSNVISISGLAYEDLTRTIALSPGEVHFLINEKNKDYHLKLRRNLLGGPSIVFCVGVLSVFSVRIKHLFVFSDATWPTSPTSRASRSAKSVF